MFGFDYLHTSEAARSSHGPATEGEPDDQEATDESQQVKVLVAKCFETKCVFAHVVPQKGVDPERYAVDRLVKDIQWLGHTKVILRSDNEPAIQKLLSETLKTLRVEGMTMVAENHPPPYDPSSNGAIAWT